MVSAITSNIEYLSGIHKVAADENKNTKEQLAAVIKFNDQLQDSNFELKQKVLKLEKDLEELHRMREEIASLLIDS